MQDQSTSIKSNNSEDNVVVSHRIRDAESSLLNEVLVFIHNSFPNHKSGVYERKIEVHRKYKVKNQNHL